MKIDIHHLIWTYLVPIEVKNTQLAEIQNHKGTLFKNFLRGLSTNEKPVFWALNQWEAPIEVRIFLLAKFGVYQSNDNQPIRCDWSTNAMQFKMKLGFQWTANGVLIGSQSNAYWQPIKCQLTTNLKTINTKLKANWPPIECQSTTNFKQINNQSDTYWEPNWCQLKTNLMPIDIQSDANQLPIKSKLRSIRSDMNQSCVNWGQNHSIGTESIS